MNKTKIIVIFVVAKFRLGMVDVSTEKAAAEQLNKHNG